MGALHHVLAFMYPISYMIIFFLLCRWLEKCLFILHAERSNRLFALTIPKSGIRIQYMIMCCRYAHSCVSPKNILYTNIYTRMEWNVNEKERTKKKRKTMATSVLDLDKTNPCFFLHFFGEKSMVILFLSHMNIYMYEYMCT